MMDNIYQKQEDELSLLKQASEAPPWYTVKSYITVSGGYLLPGETPRAMYKRVSNAAAEGLGMPEMADVFFDDIWNNWLCPASPVLTNLGVERRGQPISCFGVKPLDGIDSIMKKSREVALLTKNGGGVGIGINDIRPKGSLIAGGVNGTSDGIIPFCKIYDSTIVGISQGSCRRGAASLNLDIQHKDWEEFARIRRPEGDINRQCPNIHHNTSVSDKFMDAVWYGGYEERLLWSELLRTRMETGEPYLMFKDAVNRGNPLAYKNNGLIVDMTNICTEISLYCDHMHSFVCCLSSLNLLHYHVWNNTDLVKRATMFLTGVINRFIETARNVPGMDCAVRFAEKSKAIGIGVLGWHSLLQKNMIPFASFGAMTLNNEIFSHISEKSEEASRELATMFGEPEWCKGTGLHHSHRTAVAPTRSNSAISGNMSAGIEPLSRNVFVDRSAKGNFYEKNGVLEQLLEDRGCNTKEVWDTIKQDKGSVKNVDCLSEEEKKVFLTAYEIPQDAIIRQAAQRQPYICQSQSLNTFFPQGTEPEYFNRIHLLAWKLGVKNLYYTKSTSGIQVDTVDGNRKRATKIEDCPACEG